MWGPQICLQGPCLLTTPLYKVEILFYFFLYLKDFFFKQTGYLMIIMKYSQFFVNSKKGNEVGLKWKILSFREKTKIFTDETWWENMGDGEVDILCMEQN